MRTYLARLRELRLDPSGRRQAWIDCPAAALPAPGQYALASTSEPCEKGDILPETLFPAEVAPGSFLTTAQLPPSWVPGATLELRSPLGGGFHLPEGARQVALVSLGESPAPLLPLARLALEQDRLAALFTDGALPSLPPALEVHPLASLPEALAWADFIALGLPVESLPELRSRLGLSPAQRLPCPAQALVTIPMPCGGIADCGACAVPARRGWKLACKDGPVFDLEALSW